MYLVSPITSLTGNSCGLEIGKIVSDLVDADKLAKQTQITNQTKILTAKLSGVGTLQSAVAAFQDALKALANKDSRRCIAPRRVAGNVVPTLVRSRCPSKPCNGGKHDRDRVLSVPVGSRDMVA